MSVGMVTYFVALCYDATGKMRLDVHVFPDHIKRGLDITSPKDVEKARRITGMRPIIKGHRDIGLMPQAPGMCDAN